MRRRTALGYGTQPGVTTGAAVPGNVALHERPFAATNAGVVGPAVNRAPEGGHDARANGSSIVHVVVVTTPVPASVTVNLATDGSAMHAVADVTTPRSNDHPPAGVMGAFCGNASTRMAWHGPGLHVALVTWSVTTGSGSTAELHASNVRNGIA